MSATLLALLLIAGLVALPLLWLCVRNPVIGCAVLIVAIPMTGGLGKSLIPGFRVSEVLTLMIAAAALLNRLLDREHRPLSPLDIPIGAFALGIVIIPTLVLFAGNESGDLEAWRRVVGPLQYLTVYGILSRSRVDESQQRLLLNLALGTSVVVSLIGVLQILDLLGMREFLQSYYPRPGTNPGICEYELCRPTSVLQHWSSFGAYALLHYTLALALAATPGHRVNGRWLGVAVGMNAVGVFASLTQATVLGLGLATVLVVLHRRRIPRVLGAGALMGLIGIAILWPEISARLAAQIDSPDSLLVRQRYWSEFFIPLAGQHPWFGTGAIISTEVPTSLVFYVDNEYLGMMFRAGLVGIGLMALALVSIGVEGVRMRAHANPFVQAAGAALMADVVVLAAMGTTAEYITFGGVSQAFWMTVGFLAQASLKRHAEARETMNLSAPHLIPSRVAIGGRR